MLTDQFSGSAKTVGIGNISGMYSGSFSVFDNPAALVSTHYSVSTLQTELPDPYSGFMAFSVSMPLYDGHLALGVMSMSSKNLDKTAKGDFDQIYSESQFSVSDRLYVLGWQCPFSLESSFGLSLKYSDQNLFDTRGNGFNMDFGYLWQKGNSKVVLGAKNVLPSKVVYSADNSQLSFPFEASVGGRYQFLDIGLMGQAMYCESGNLFLTSLGLDYALEDTGLSVQLGWKEVPFGIKAYDVSSVGLGLFLKPIDIAVAYEFSDFAQQSSRYTVSLSAKF